MMDLIVYKVFFGLLYQVLSPLKEGVVVDDWELVDSIWDHAFR